MKSLVQLYQETYTQCISEDQEYHHSDKGTNHSYIEYYESLFAPYREQSINFLEIGVNRGYSMLTWMKYFQHGTFWGIDNQNTALHRSGFTYIVEDINNTSSVLSQLGSINFDIIIDDGSHKIHDQKLAIDLLLPKLSKGGLFVIEDIDNIDETTSVFSPYNPEIIDRRQVKSRYDDVLVIIRK